MIKIFYTAAGSQIGVNDHAVFDNGKVLINPTKEGCLPGFKVAISISDSDSRFGDIIVNYDELEPCIDFETGLQLQFETVSAFETWMSDALMLHNFSGRAQFVCFRDYVTKLPVSQDELVDANLRANAAAILAGATDAVTSNLAGEDFVVQSSALSTIVDQILSFTRGNQVTFKKSDLALLKKACAAEMNVSKGIGFLTKKFLTFMEG